MTNNKKNTSSSSTPEKLNNLVNDLKNNLNDMEIRVKQLEGKNEQLEAKVEILESQKKINEQVTSQLGNEIDCLSQYTRRSNLIIKNVFKPEKESNEDVMKKVKNIIEKELNMLGINNEIDKMHRIGKVKEENGKKKQEVIIKFKTHAVRYAVYDARKKARSAKFLPNER